MAKCRIGECWNDVRYHHLQVCAACYSGLATWRGRNPQEKMERMAQINRLADRMEFMIENPKVHPRRMPKRGKRRKRGKR